MPSKSELKLIKSDVKSLLREGFIYSDKLHKRMISYADPEEYNTFVTTIYPFHRSFSISISYDGKLSMVVFFGRRNLLCKLLAFEDDDSINIGAAAKELTCYKGCEPTCEDFLQVNIDEGIFRDFVILKSLIEPLAKDIHTKFYKNLGQN